MIGTVEPLSASARLPAVPIPPEFLKKALATRPNKAYHI